MLTRHALSLLIGLLLAIAGLQARPLLHSGGGGGAPSPFTFTVATVTSPTFTEGAAASTIVGAVSVSYTGSLAGTITVSLSGTNAQGFRLSGSSYPGANLICPSGGCPSGAGPFTDVSIVATDASATNSPFTGSALSISGTPPFTFTSASITSSTFTEGAAASTVVGPVSVAYTGTLAGTITVSLSGTNAQGFRLSGSSYPGASLICPSGGCPSGAGPFTDLSIVATDASATNNPFTGSALSITGISSSCTFNDSISGSCLVSSDTTDSISGPRSNAPGTADTFNFSSGGNLQTNGGGFTCLGAFNNNGAATDCTATTQLHVCQTPGNITSGAHPWATEGVVSWIPTAPISYNTGSLGTWYAGLPTYNPALTFENTSGYESLNIFGIPPASVMTSLCGANTNSYFVSSTLGNMPNIFTALFNMRTGDTVTIHTQPTGIPYWPSGENPIGGNAADNAPYDLTVNIDAGTMFGFSYPNEKGLFLVNQSGTTINGGTCYWVNPANNQACIAWVAGLDLTVKNFRGETANTGIVRAYQRQGITNFSNVTFEDMGSGNSGLNHGIYTGYNITGGFDVLFADNVVIDDVGQLGWGLKIRGGKSQITNSFSGARVNNGTAATHGPIDFPCGGTQSITNSAFNANGYSLNYYFSNQASNFLVSTDEERSAFCLQIQMPSSTGFTATIIDKNTFTTTTNPATLAPLLESKSLNMVWDKNVNPNLMVNGPAQISGWSGPVAGVYTVSTICFNSNQTGTGLEGILPIVYGRSIISCFATTPGSPVTLYASGAPMTLLTNTACPSTCTVSYSTPIDPGTYGIQVGDILTNPDNVTITSITGSGPYTINASCTAPYAGGTTCLSLPQFNWTINGDPVASGTYNSSTGAVSLVLGWDIGLAPGSSVQIGNLYGTGAVSSLNGTWTATAGTGGTTLNYTAASGLGAITIGTQVTSSFVGGVVGINFPSCPGADPTTSKLCATVTPIKIEAQHITASTTGSGCDGTNTLCGLPVDPLAMFVWHGMQVVGGPNVATACIVAARVVSIQPVGGSSGTGYTVGDTITLAGGTGPTAAAVQVATTGAGGAVTGVTVTNGGVFTSFVTAQADHKTWTQASTSGSGTGAQFEFPYPHPIVTGSGPYTLRLAQTSGANCVTGSSTNQVYKLDRPSSITMSNDIIGWDGPCTFGPCTILTTAEPASWKVSTISNSLLWTNISASDAGSAGVAGQFGPAWSTSHSGNTLDYGMTDGGGNVLCNNRKDLTTSPRCAIPPFTAAVFTGKITGTTPGASGGNIGTLTATCLGGSSCMAITSGTYNNSNGLVTLTVPVSDAVPFYGDRHNNGQSLFSVSGLTGTGSLSALNGNWQAWSTTTGTVLSYNADPGQGSITITGGNVNAISAASACKPGMFVWDNSGAYIAGYTGHVISGTEIVSGSGPTFQVLIPPGGIVTTDMADGTIFACGYGMPSSAFNGTINSSGVLTVNSGLVGSIHVGDYLADVFSVLPANVRISSGSGTTWQTTYSGGGVGAEYMVSVRSLIP